MVSLGIAPALVPSCDIFSVKFIREMRSAQNTKLCQYLQGVMSLIEPFTRSGTFMVVSLKS